jgi:hypothetical protein
MTQLDTIRWSFAGAFGVVGFIGLLLQLFPSMRGPSWQESDTLAVIVLVLLAILIKP